MPNPPSNNNKQDIHRNYSSLQSSLNMIPSTDHFRSPPYQERIVNPSSIPNPRISKQELLTIINEALSMIEDEDFFSDGGVQPFSN